MRFWTALALAVAILFSGPVVAGRGCEEKPLSPEAYAQAADTAQNARRALDEYGADVALLSRHGTDLSKHGLHYSHMGFAVRDRTDGSWRIVHLLNECGTDDSAIHVEGLLNFFAANLVSQDMRIDWLGHEHARALLPLLQGDQPLRLHDPDYNILARYDSERMQNSTAWNLEMLAAARLSSPVTRTRELAQAQAMKDGFDPDIIRVPYGKRVMGGLVTANVSFTDHPIATRLSGRYPVVTVRSIIRYLQRLDAIEQTREWRNGREITPLSP